MRRLATGLMAAAALALLATGVHAEDKRKVKIGTEGRSLSLEALRVRV